MANQTLEAWNWHLCHIKSLNGWSTPILSGYISLCKAVLRLCVMSPLCLIWSCPISRGFEDARLGSYLLNNAFSKQKSHHFKHFASTATIWSQCLVLNSHQPCWGLSLSPKVSPEVVLQGWTTLPQHVETGESSTQAPWKSTTPSHKYSSLDRYRLT